jgi:hypothetical protein
MINAPVRYGYFWMGLLVIALLLGHSFDAAPIFGEVMLNASYCLFSQTVETI